MHRTMERTVLQVEQVQDQEQGTQVKTTRKLEVVMKAKTELGLSRVVLGLRGCGAWSGGPG